MEKRKYRELSRNTLIFFAGSMGSRLISFLLVPVYTYILSTREYGTIDIINSTVALLVPVLTLNIQDAVLRFALDREYAPEDIISSAARLIALSTAVLTAFVIVLTRSSVLSFGKQYIGYLILSFALNGCQRSFSMYLRAKDQVKVIAVSGILSTVLTGALNICFLLAFHMGVMGYLLANLIAAFCENLYLFVRGGIYRDIGRRTDRAILRAMLLYSCPLILNTVAWWLNSASDRYILTYYCGAALNGIYAVSYKIPNILSSFQGLFYNAWSISAIKEFDAEDSDGFVGNIYTITSGGSLIICSMLLILNPWISRVLYAKEFYEAWRYTPFILIGVYFNGLSLMEGCLYTAVKRTKDVTKTTLVGAGVNTLLNLALIPRFGAYGAAIATMTGYIASWAARTMHLRTFIRMKVSWGTQIIAAVLIVCQSIAAARGTKTILIQLACLVGMVYIQRQSIGETIAFIIKNLRSKRNPSERT